MATKPINNIVRSVNQYSLFEDASNLVDATVSWNCGDLLFLDTTAHLISPVAAGADGATCLGVSRVSIVDGKMVGPYQGTKVDASEKASAIPGPVSGVVAKLLLEAGDAFNPGDKVYASSTDAQTVTSTAGMLTSIGIYQGPAVATAVLGQRGEIYLISPLA